MIMQAVEKTIPKPEIAVLDWKGLGKYKEKIKIILDEIGLGYERTDHILK